MSPMYLGAGNLLVIYETVSYITYLLTQLSAIQINFKRCKWAMFIIINHEINLDQLDLAEIVSNGRRTLPQNKSTSIKWDRWL